MSDPANDSQEHLEDGVKRVNFGFVTDAPYPLPWYRRITRRVRDAIAAGLRLR